MAVKTHCSVFSVLFSISREKDGLLLPSFSKIFYTGDSIHNITNFNTTQYFFNNFWRIFKSRTHPYSYFVPIKYRTPLKINIAG